MEATLSVGLVLLITLFAATLLFRVEGRLDALEAEKRKRGSMRQETKTTRGFNDFPDAADRILTAYFEETRQMELPQDWPVADRLTAYCREYRRCSDDLRMVLLMERAAGPLPWAEGEAVGNLLAVAEKIEAIREGTPCGS